MQEISSLQESDFLHISTNLDEWWGGRNMVPMLPRLWFKDSQPIAFLVGYISQIDNSKAYVHFIGVDPYHRKDNLGRSLYEAFSRKAAELGANRIEAVTSPTNATSLRFHESLGFLAKEIGGELVLPTQALGHKDYNGVGADRVILIKTLQK